MIKNIFKKPFSYILAIVGILAIIWINKNYSQNITINFNDNINNNNIALRLKKDNNMPKKINNNTKTAQLLELSSDNQKAATSEDKIIEKNIFEDKVIEKNITNTINRQINIVVLRCEPLKNKDKIFFFKQGGFYGEVYDLKTTLFYIFYNNCLWLWSSNKKSGLKICSSEINIPLIDFNPEKINDDEINETLKKRNLGFSCSKTKLNETKFLPPTNIKFLPVDLDKQNLQNIF
jgi:hypothetical protein